MVMPLYQIEPGERAVVEWMDDEWTVVTADGSLSAHYENTVLITDGDPEILTLTEKERKRMEQ